MVLKVNRTKMRTVSFIGINESDCTVTKSFRFLGAKDMKTDCKFVKAKRRKRRKKEKVVERKYRG